MAAAQCLLKLRADADVRGEGKTTRRIVGFSFRVLYWDYIGIMEKKMEAIGILGVK